MPLIHESNKVKKKKKEKKTKEGERTSAGFDFLLNKEENITKQINIYQGERKEMKEGK